MEAARRKPPPDWDKREVARPYLDQLQTKYRHDEIEEGFLDALFSGLSQELRSVYFGGDADKALEGLDRLIGKYDVADRERRAVTPSRSPIEILQRWMRISRHAMPRTAETRPQDSYSNHTASFASSSEAKTPQHLKAQWTGADTAAAFADARQRVQEAKITPPTPSTGLASKIKINGPAMRKSLFGTWMMLVIMCWVAMICYFVLSIPLGLGSLGASYLAAGFFAIPLLASIFGWWGMGRASNAALRDMKFKEVPPDHPLAVISGAFARDLGLPPPRIGTMDVHNAFAMGTNPRQATISVGLPLLETLSADEVAAIIGHELGHVVSGDMSRMVLMRTFQAAAGWWLIVRSGRRLMGAVMLFAGELMILAKSRNREYYADAVGAALAGKQAMISVLRKMEGAPALTPNEKIHARAMARGKVSGMFSTHPPFSARIEALERETFIRRLPRSQ